MMKKTFTGLILCIFSLTVAQAAYTEQLADNDMYLFVHHEEAISELQQSCGQAINTKGQETANSINQSILNNMKKMSQVEQFLYARDLYQKVSSIYPLVFNMGREQKCYYGHIFISLQLLLREHNIDILDQNNILSDFANVEEKEEDKDKTKSNKFRNEFITHYGKKYQDIAQKLPTQIRITPTTLTNIETATEKVLAKSLMELTTNMTYSTINDLYDRKYITKTEVEDLLSKITINYKPDTCSSYHGKFSVSHLIKDGKKHNATISHIHLNINGCYNIFILGELEKTMEILILHEIGGHLGHYVKDTEREKFQAICRESKEVRNNNCSENDFVSPYAITNSFEDYAETFTYRWLDSILTKRQ